MCCGSASDKVVSCILAGCKIVAYSEEGTLVNSIEASPLVSCLLCFLVVGLANFPACKRIDGIVIPRLLDTDSYLSSLCGLLKVSAVNIGVVKVGFVNCGFVGN